MAVCYCGAGIRGGTARRGVGVGGADRASILPALPWRTVSLPVRPDPAAAAENGEVPEPVFATAGQTQSEVNIVYFHKRKGRKSRPVCRIKRSGKNFVENRKKFLTMGLWCGTLIKLSAKKERAVPCKLNNAKTNKHLGQ